MATTDSGSRRGTLALVVCCISLLITTSDISVVNVVLSAIGRDLRTPAGGLQWTVDG